MVRIITDSSCDLSLEDAKKMNIEILPINVHFDDKSYTPMVDLSNEKFYSMLSEAKELPTTTQISPIVFEESFSEHINNGDEVVGLFISKELSGTYQNAVNVANFIDNSKIHVVDTLNTTFGLALLLSEAVKMRDEGLNAREIHEKITALVPRLRLVASVETLKYLKMGGRLSAGAALIGGILGIYPIISVVNGKVEAIGKARGQQAAYKFMEEYIKKNEISSDYGVSFGNSNAPELGKKTIKTFSHYVGKRDIINTQIGSVIGTHIGSGATGIAFIQK